MLKCKVINGEPSFTIKVEENNLGLKPGEYNLKLDSQDNPHWCPWEYTMSEVVLKEKEFTLLSEPKRVQVLLGTDMFGETHYDSVDVEGLIEVGDKIPYAEDAVCNVHPDDLQDDTSSGCLFDDLPF
jgi:hypothetical protein